MKRYFTTVFLGLGLCQAALAGIITTNHSNYGLISFDNPVPEVDAISFYNQGIFQVDTVTALSLTNKNSVFGLGSVVFTFATKDTLYFTNTTSGLMEGVNGFDFETIGSKSTHAASYFVNQGIVEGVDTWDFPYLYSIPGATVFVPIPVDSQPIPSQVIVVSTNIINSGAMSVGNAGLLRLTGSNVNTSFGTLAAGSVSTAGLFPDPLDTTGIQGWEDWEFTGPPNQEYYGGSPGVYDLFWGITNGDSVQVDGLAGSLPEGLPLVVGGLGTRGLDAFIGPPINDNPMWSVSAILYPDNNTGTNWYYNLVFVNTNFSNPNITATVGFTGFDDLQFVGNITDGNPEEDIVQIAEPVFDVITGQMVTNGIYLVDDGAVLPTMSLALNATVPEPYMRPNAFALSTVTPPEWVDALIVPGDPGNYDPDLIFTPNTFNNNKEPLEISDYGAQIGHNPADVAGSFSSLVDPNSSAFLPLFYDQVNLLDPTNEPGRIEINADNLNISQARLRAEGMVILNVTNLIGGGTSAVDFGEANAALGVTNGALTIMNVFPTNFQRIRGDIYAASATWQNTQTNPMPIFGITGTNQWHYHVLVVDQNLFGSFPFSVRNLTLTGKNSVVLEDSLNVIGKAVFNTTNLTLDSSNYFGQNAQNFTPANTPYMQNLFVTSNGFLGSSNILDVGFNQNVGASGPAGRTYTVHSITNFGQMISIAPLLQSAIFENDGIVTANNGGSMLIEASNLCLGLALPNTSNYLVAGGSVNLSATTIQARNSVISAGQTEPASLMLNATVQLTDLVSGVPTTNTNSVITNYWTVTDGFFMPIKPATGDLFGTQIHTIATGLQYVTHVWAGTDFSNNAALGFNNNEVIGRLVLDRQSPQSILHFSAAGAKNAMYVDYLVLTNYGTNYRAGLAIDPNFTIYFANCNITPEKLTEIYPNLVWVTNFVGPNSTQVVPYINSTIVCLMNAGVANSQDIAFWNGIANYYFLQQYGPYLLNGPFGTNFMNCPGDYTFPCNCAPGSNAYQLLYTSAAAGGETNLLTVAYNGQGSISPVLTAGQLVLGGSYTLTAKPATGWVFDYWTTALEGALVNTNSYSPTLTFTFVTNTVVTANFIPIPFPSLAGLYNGLFFETNQIAPGTSGALSLTLAKTGSFSGKLVMGSSNYPFASQFSGSGAASFQAGTGASSLTVNLQLDITNFSGQISGDVNGGSWDSPLAANLAPVWTAKNPSPFAGSYTMSLPWETGTDTNDLAGDSYGAGTFSALGVLTMAGSLADGVAYSATAPVSQSGQWPFYAYAAAGKDYVLGWVTVSNGLSGTNIGWSKLAGKGSLYPGGFSTVLQLTGSPWHAPLKGSSALSLTNPSVTLSAGDLPLVLNIPIKTQTSLAFGATNLSLSINSATGAFTGWFDSPGTRKQVPIFGVVLSNEDIARGFFLGGNESGPVLLQGQ